GATTNLRVPWTRSRARWYRSRGLVARTTRGDRRPARDDVNLPWGYEHVRHGCAEAEQGEAADGRLLRRAGGGGPRADGIRSPLPGADVLRRGGLQWWGVGHQRTGRSAGPAERRRR